NGSRWSPTPELSVSDPRLAARLLLEILRPNGGFLVRRLLAATAVLISALTAANAETWPTRPIRAVIPFGPGSAVDVVPRIVFEQMSKQLGQPIVVENR